MCRRTALHLSLAVALFAAAVTSRAMADPTPGWPDSHSSAYLGVHIEEVTPEQVAALKLNQTSGALITYVDQDGPACRAGLKNNDVIVGFNGSKVENAEQLGSLIHSTAAGTDDHPDHRPQQSEQGHESCAWGLASHAASFAGLRRPRATSSFLRPGNGCAHDPRDRCSFLHCAFLAPRFSG